MERANKGTQPRNRPTTGGVRGEKAPRPRGFHSKAGATGTRRPKVAVTAEEWTRVDATELRCIRVVQGGVRDSTGRRDRKSISRTLRLAPMDEEVSVSNRTPLRLSRRKSRMRYVPCVQTSAGRAGKPASLPFRPWASDAWA